MKLIHLIIAAIFLMTSPAISLAERIEYPNGDVYEGAAINGVRHGLGMLTIAAIPGSKALTIYEGEWKDDKLQGFGKLHYPKVGLAYEGDFKNTQEVQGFRKVTFPSGASYEGEGRGGKRHGFGKQTNPNGDIYIGEFKEDKRHGMGKYEEAGRKSLVGLWRNDKFKKERKIDFQSQLTTWNNKSHDFREKSANLEVAMQRLNKSKTRPSSYDNDELIAAASGTGFFVSNEGHLVTNNHVISHCSQIKLKISGQLQDAQVITRDKVNDLALLKSSFKNFKTIPISSSNPKLLQDIYAAGFPFGSSVSSSVKVTKGIVSSLSGVADNFSNVQIDAALQPGNSGGPIVDEYGNAVAVSVAKLDLETIIKAYGVVPENTNFGIKATVVRNLLEANNIQASKPNTTKLSGSELGQRITQGTVHLSCLMTMAQIEQVRDQKVLFTEYN